jgi:hypothetical protein
MKLLISTYAHWLLWDDGRVQILREGHGKRPGDFVYFGCSWNRHTVFVCEGSTDCQNRVYTYDARGRCTGQLPFTDIKGPHQCYWWDGSLYVANTQRNRVEVWGRGGVRHIRWAKETRDTEHINSIWCDGEQFYVVGHRWKFQPKKIWVFGLDWKLRRVIDIVVREETPGMHNVYIEDGVLYTLGPRDVIKYDLRTGDDTRTRTGYYLRGLARVPGRFLVGASQKCERKGRAEGDSQFHILDDDLNLLETVTLKDTGGITEIRAVDPPDLAHNGLPCPMEV